MVLLYLFSVWLVTFSKVDLKFYGFNQYNCFCYRCETHPDGHLLLHYYTVRPGLYPIVLGTNYTFYHNFSKNQRYLYTWFEHWFKSSIHTHDTVPPHLVFGILKFRSNT